ncbi:MAG: 2-oxo acid dehydrogenase subunit E2, partial [Desulfohalobiaceae bacterium]|nr:2-oxo acid dehydrogenase subunit E2 [Desulfohalobiaceae bacterium]
MATEVVVPMLGVTVEKGKIVEWLKSEGDQVEKGEALFVVEAEKVTTEVEAPATGVLAKIFIPADREMPVLSLAGLIIEPGEEIPEEYRKVASPAPPEKGGGSYPEQTPDRKKNAPEARDTAVKAVPAARRLARRKEVDLAGLSGTGPDGIIRYQDVEQAAVQAQETTAKASTLASRFAAKQGVDLDQVQGTGVRGRIMQNDVQEASSEQTAPGLGKVIPMNSMRQVIARRMSESAFTVPHISFFSDIVMDPLLAFRKAILPDFGEQFDLRPSVNDFLIKAVSLNILDFPMLNAQLKENEIHIMPEINVCLAVALPEGLIVPALSQTDQAGFADLVRQRRDLVNRAKSGTLTMDELQRGTFTISSLAQFDITHFTAIINPPQSGILSVCKARDELYLDDGQVKTRKVMTLGLSVDHRIIDGAMAADFLQHLK